MSKDSLLIIDMLAETNGHLLDDDFFLASTLKNHFAEVRVLTSPASVENLHAEVPEVRAAVLCAHRGWMARLPYRAKMLFRVLSAGRAAGGRVLFQSFEELAVFVYSLFNPGVEIFLKVTCNLGSIKTNWKRRLAIRLAFARATGILVHCDYEKRLIQEIFKIAPEKIHVIKFHQFGKPAQFSDPGKRERIISYIGGGRADQGLDRFFSLAAAAPFPEYRYSLNSCLPENVSCPALDRLELNIGFLSTEEYYDKFYRSRYVILPYTKDYEGKTSGIFCDAVATGTPVIVPCFEPFISFFEQYGPLGYMVDFEDARWYDGIVDIDSEENYRLYQDNLRKVREAYDWNAIARQIAEALQRKV